MFKKYTVQLTFVMQILFANIQFKIYIIIAAEEPTAWEKQSARIVVYDSYNKHDPPYENEISNDNYMNVRITASTKLC